jgi:hypothetical protein
MKTWICRARLVLSVVAVILATGSVSYAEPISGSLPLAGLGVTQNGANLSLSTMISATDTITSGPGVDNLPLPPPPGFSLIPTLTSFGPNTIHTTNLVGFTLTNAIYGSFVSTGGVVVQQTPNFLDLFYTGTFTPGPGLPGLDPTSASLRISINQSGASLSEAITLNSPSLAPPSAVPEPASLSLLGVGLAAVGGYAWRRRRVAVCG